MCELSKREILRYAGHKGTEISPELDALLDSCISKITSSSVPRFTYAVSEPDFLEKGIFLNGLKLTGNDIYKHLTGAKKCIILACTLGAGFETELSRLQAKSMTEALLFDATGTAFIEAYADKCEKEILLPFKREGYFSNFRYSPGYGDLPLTLQKDIINILDTPKKIGLTVTDSDIMIPRKSITAFIGLFDNPKENQKASCEGCSLYNECQIRKEGKCCD